MQCEISVTLTITLTSDLDLSVKPRFEMRPSSVPAKQNVFKSFHKLA